MPLSTTQVLWSVLPCNAWFSACEASSICSNVCGYPRWLRKPICSTQSTPVLICMLYFLYVLIASGESSRALLSHIATVPMLQSSAPSRVINVSSTAAWNPSVPLLSELPPKEEGYAPFR
jgi:hypothetical protein